MANKIKHKTRKIVSKRFKITATGKVLRRTPGMRHLRRKKNKKSIQKIQKIYRSQRSHGKKN